MGGTSRWNTYPGWARAVCAAAASLLVSLELARAKLVQVRLAAVTPWPQCRRAPRRRKRQEGT